jgi:peptide/nickel transport system substrate-binding protein
MSGPVITRRGALAAGSAAAIGLAAPSVWGQAINRDRIILCMTQEPVQFNPLLYVNAGTENVPEACLFDALWDIDATGTFIPNLAAAVPSPQNGGISPDGLTWRVNLKRDVKWSDGQPFTARDVEFTYQTIMSPSVAVRSRSGFDLIKTFRVIDDHTVEMVLEKPFVPFLWAWQNMHIVPHHILSRESNIQTSGFNAQPIGTGPYLLRSRTAGSHMVYERNPNYHRGPAKVRQFIHTFVPDGMVAYGRARTGEVDYLALLGVPPDRWAEARAFPDRDFLVYPTPNVQFVYYNCGKPQFADPRVRKALTMALEMQKSIDDIYFGTMPRSLSYLQPTHWAYNSNLRDYTADPAGAERLLDEAGWRRGPDGIRAKDGVQMKFLMSTTAGNTARQGCQALFQQNWRRIGVEMEIRNMPASVVWGEFTTQSRFDTLLVAWDPTVGLDPDYTARAHSRMIPVKHRQGSNYVQYENAEVDRLFELGVTQTDQAQRIQTYHRIQEILHEEVPFAAQGGSVQGHLKKKPLTGPTPNQYVTDITWNVQDWAWA